MRVSLRRSFFLNGQVGMRPLQNASTVGSRRSFDASRDRGLNSAAPFIARSAAVEAPSTPLSLKATWNSTFSRQSSNSTRFAVRHTVRPCLPHLKLSHTMHSCCHPTSALLSPTVFSSASSQTRSRVPMPLGRPRSRVVSRASTPGRLRRSPQRRYLPGCARSRLIDERSPRFSPGGQV